MKIEKIKITLLFIFAIVPISCIIIEIIGNTIWGLALRHHDKPHFYSFDIVLISQTIYFSVWTAVLTSCWGTAKIISHFKKNKKIAWAESENVLTMVFTYNFITMLIYSFTMIISRDGIVGFNSTYSIIKSTLEHWIVPLLLMFYYFSLRKKSQIVSIKEYAKNDAWKNMIIPVFYIAYVIVRCIFIYKFSNPKDVPAVFPYDQVSPYNHDGTIQIKGVLLALTAVIAFLGCSYLWSIMFEFISIRSSIKFQGKFLNNSDLNANRIK